MYKENAAEEVWSEQEYVRLKLARETEWAEAYADYHPECPMGGIYLEFLRREMITAQGKL